MILKNWPSGFSGGIIGLSIFILGLIILALNILDFLAGIIISLPVLIIENYIVISFGLKNICGSVAYAFHCPMYIDVICFSIVGCIYFFGGVLIGYIYGKIKSRKESKIT